MLAVLDQCVEGAHEGIRDLGKKETRSITGLLYLLQMCHISNDQQPPRRKKHTTQVHGETD